MGSGSAIPINTNKEKIRYPMNVFAILDLVSCVIIFTLGIFVFCINKKEPVHRAFLFMCLIASAWAFTEFMFRQAGSYENAFFWMKTTAVWTFVMPVTLYFAVVFTERTLNRLQNRLLVLMFLIAAVFTIIELATDLIIVAPRPVYWGYSYIFSNAFLLYPIEMLWSFGVALVALVLCIDYYHKTSDPRKKHQAKFVLVGAAIPTLAGFITQEIGPFFQLAIPEMTTICMLGLSGMVGYAIWRYELFELSPATAADKILSTIPDLLVLIDASERIVTVNRAARDLLGYPDGMLIGMPFNRLSGNDTALSSLPALIVKSGSVSDYETIISRHNKEVIPVSISGSVIRGRDGEIAGIVTVFRDISERKRAENDLRESEARLNSVLHGSPIPQFVIDQNHHVISWNRALEEYSGVKSADVIGTNLHYTAFYGAPEPCLADLVVDGTAGGKFAQSKYIDGAYDGENFFPNMGSGGTWLHYTAAPVQDAHGKVIGAVESMEDISEQRLLEKEMVYYTAELKRYAAALAQTNEKLNLLNSITRHDMANKITGLSAYLEISREITNDPAILEYLRLEMSIVSALQDQIEFTRTYQDMGVKAPEWCNAEEQIMDAAAQLPLLNITLSVQLDGICLYADPLVGKVFYNLMENGLRHGEHITRISYSLIRNDADAIIVYEDNGVGVEPENKERIFLKGVGKHTGFGLFLIHEILAITGIHIAETGEYGKGARFEIRIPNGQYRFPEQTR
jgi:PAS domain S-box-containing protein